MHRQKIDVVYASPGRVTPGGLGRYCRHYRSPWMHEPAYREFLHEMVAKDSFDVILPLCEPLQRIAWDLPEPFASRVFPSATHEQRRLLDDRRAMYEFVANLGIPVPRMMPVTSPADFEPIARELGWPLVLRGTQGVAGQQVRIVQDQADLTTAYDALQSESPQPLFAQAFVPGTRTVMGTLLQDGAMLRAFAHRSLETYPGATGPSIRGRSIVDPRLLDHASRLFRALNWNGLALAEFMHGHDGEYYFMEINPRPWATILIAEACGAPMIGAFIRRLKGESVDAQPPYVIGREVPVFPGFLSARIRAGGFPRVRDLGSYLRLFRAIPAMRLGVLWHHTRTLAWEWRHRDACRSE